MLNLPAHVPVVTLERGGLVEGVHHGSMAVLDAAGGPLALVGDVAAPFYPRSALKPLQAVAMLRHGLQLPPDLLALATASHSGGPEHLSRVHRILELTGAGLRDLRNVADLPLGEPERARWLASGRGPEQVAQNCSGKHAAMLTTCRLNGWETAGYLEVDHPLQRAVAATIEEFTGEPVAAVTTDGCGAPLFAVSVLGLARATLRLVSADPASPEGQVAAALREHPGLVAGRGRASADLVRAVPGLAAKDGYESVQIAGLTGAGALALKIADGGDRARLPLASAGLALLGVDEVALQPFATQPVLGGGHRVGTLQALPLDQYRNCQ
ncbi:asparaginase [Kineococcus sp. SYSU DK003]|uniref:asparaginase n=1 Tax=Kineococcus sp. SYSU DK003 TaxID=3383124 RepID=UPI003D7E68C4